MRLKPICQKVKGSLESESCKAYWGYCNYKLVSTELIITVCSLSQMLTSLLNLKNNYSSQNIIVNIYPTRVTKSTSIYDKMTSTPYCQTS